jgi:integrase
MKLTEFFTQRFKPARLRDCGQPYIHTFERAIAWLAYALEREPNVDDLHAANLRRMMRLQYRSGIRYFTVKKMRAKLSTLWKFAVAEGLLEIYEVVPTLKPKQNVHAFLETPPPAGSLRDFFMRRYRNARPNLKRDAVVNRLDVFVGRYVMLEEIDDALLRRFAEWLSARGMPAETAGRYLGTVRAIVRKFDPVRFPPPGKLDKLPPAKPGTLRHFVDNVFAIERLYDVADTTRYQFKLAMRRLHDHYGDIKLDEMTDAIAADHFQWLRRERELKAVTVNGSRTYWFMAWRYAYEKGLVSKLPTLRKLKETVPPVDCWEPDECRTIIANVGAAVVRPRFGFDAEAFWRAVLLLDWYTGARAGTLLKLRRRDLDFATGWLSIPGEFVKNRRSKKYRLAQEAVDAVRLVADDERLLPFPFSREAFHSQFRRILQAADVSPGQRDSMHRLHRWRRSVATEIAVRLGLHAAMAMLDHQDMKTTMRYVDVSRLPGHDMSIVLPPLLIDVSGKAGVA